MSSYYHCDEELIGAGMQPGEVALYTGTTLDGLRGGPSICSPSNVFVFSREEEGVLELDVCFQNNVLEVSAHGDHYVFLRNEQEDLIQQVSGPAKPVIVANIGARAIRVNTPLGKFLIPAGAMFRLEQNAPLQREKKKVLLTFSDEAEQTQFLQSALMLDGGRWKPLNICADKDKVKVRDGSFTAQTLTLRSRGDNDVKLEHPPVESDYEVYFRSMTAWFEVRFAGVGMKDEGLARKHHAFSLKRNEIYDFQRLRQAPSTKLMRRCTARLPGLEELEVGAFLMVGIDGEAVGMGDGGALVQVGRDGKWKLRILTMYNYGGTDEDGIDVITDDDLYEDEPDEDEFQEEQREAADCQLTYFGQGAHIRFHAHENRTGDGLGQAVLRGTGAG